MSANPQAAAGRRPGRPRSEEARRAILEATVALAAEHGPEGLRMDAIAKRAGVSKETLYRWWRSKAEVLLEAMAERGERTIPVPDSGSLEGDLRAFMRATARSADAPTQRILRALAAEAASDTDLAALIRERFIARRRAALSELLMRAVERGELTEGDAAIALDLVFGSLWYRAIFGVGPLDRKWADAVAGAIGRMSSRLKQPPPGYPKRR
jgi:AcrR family transcriptional regulator